MVSTIDWARSHNISLEPLPKLVEWSPDPYPRTARDIAIRIVILQGIVAVAYKVDAEMVIEWFYEESLWEAVTPEEKTFLLNPTYEDNQHKLFQAHQEAAWTLLWMIGKVEALGLPTHFCDTRRMVDELIPGLWTTTESFLNSAELRDVRLLLAEDLRTYDLWCYAHRVRRLRGRVPHDLKMTVLYERRYAFEWLDSTDEWDQITCDA